jgi:hypothetical protein
LLFLIHSVKIWRGWRLSEIVTKNDQDHNNYYETAESEPKLNVDLLPFQEVTTFFLQIHKFKYWAKFWKTDH